MRFKRLTLGTGNSAVSIDFHDKLTVVAGVGAVERDCLVGELFGSLAGTRRGTRVELVDDDGFGLAVDRTTNDAQDVLVDASGTDVSATARDETGRIDILKVLGTDVETVRRRCRLTINDIASAAQGDAIIEELASKDQTQLWKIANKLAASDEILRTEAEAIGASVEDGPIIEQVERRHQEFEAAQTHHESVRHHGIFIGGACAVAAIPASLMIRWTGLAFLAVAAVFTFLSITTRRKMQTAEAAEREALDAAGAESYIGFHISRMNRLLEGQKNRERIASAAKAHRESSTAWRELVGSIDIGFAMSNKDKIIAVAARRQEIEHGGRADLTEADPAQLAQAIIGRVAELRKIGTGGQSLPLVLDEPLEGVSLSVKQWMLELIGRSAGTPQFLLFTNDPDILAWARMEAMTGQLAVIAPAGESNHVGDSSHVGVRASTHVA